MPERADTSSPPELRRSYVLVLLTEVTVIAALWAVQQLFA
jgi:hypothetical protein